MQHLVSIGGVLAWANFNSVSKKLRPVVNLPVMVAVERQPSVVRGRRPREQLRTTIAPKVKPNTISRAAEVDIVVAKGNENWA
jgi:hypothetical protein